MNLVLIIGIIVYLVTGFLILKKDDKFHEVNEVFLSLILIWPIYLFWRLLPASRVRKIAGICVFLLVVVSVIYFSIPSGWLK